MRCHTSTFYHVDSVQTHCCLLQVCNPARPRNTAKGIQDPALAQCLKGIRVAIHWEDDETFYRVGAHRNLPLGLTAQQFLMF